MLTPTICIGADGFELLICSRWMDEDYLPNLGRIREWGIRGAIGCRRRPQRDKGPTT